MTQIQSANRLLDYKDFVKYSPIFIETGCAVGDGVQRAIDAGFKEVVSIEASEDYFQHSFDRFFDNALITIVFGKSVDILPAVLDSYKFPTVIYLDAHVSGDTSAGYKDWIDNGEKSDFAQDKTIKAELKIIMEHSSKHVIIIDDVNGLKDGHALEYAEILLKDNPDYKLFFYDECLSGKAEYFYPNKLLVAIP